MNDIGRVFYEGFCAVFEQFIGISKAPKGADRIHTGGKGSLHISIGVAEIKELGGRNIQLFGDIRGPGWVWLYGRSVTYTKYNIERPIGEEFFYDELSEVIGFV